MKSDFNLKHQNENTDSRISAALERIAHAFRILLWNESKRYALTPVQVQTLIFLLNQHYKRCTVGLLAMEFGMTKATLSDVVTTLEQKGFVQRTVSDIDSRSFIIRLTPEGKSTARKVSGFSQPFHLPLEKMSRQHKESLLFSLLTIIFHLQQEGVITLQRMCFSCRFYELKEKSRQHYCHLLKKELKIEALRLDCPEFEMKES